MCDLRQFPNGSYVVTPGAGGAVTPSGFQIQNGKLVYVGMPQRALAPMSMQLAASRGYATLNPSQLADALASQTGGNGSLVASQYQATDVPGKGPASLSRAEMPGGIEGGGTTYTIILTNTAGGAVNDYRIFGDWAGTYALAQSLVPTPGSVLVVGGDAGTLSLSHLTNRALGRAIRVASMQIQALNSSYFTGNNIKYFNTTPNPQDNVEQKLLSLNTLVNADQFNPNIQTYNTSEMYDGINGLYIKVPALEKVTITMTIISESRTRSMNLLGSNG